MTVEPTYRIDRTRMVVPHRDWITQALNKGVLVPDTRLQAIADAWNSGESVGRWHANAAMRKASFRKDWPELASLLDALTKDNGE